MKGTTWLMWVAVMIGLLGVAAIAITVPA